MSTPPEITREQVEKLFVKVKRDAEGAGYQLNPDVEFVKELLRGMLENEQRYGYQSCPCRLAAGRKEEDLDIICPCNYRDGDVVRHGACYCALYVSKEIAEGKKEAVSIPESRPPAQQRAQHHARTAPGLAQLPLPVWRCTVCGYLCARQEPPELCPICKVKKERFERFI